ncbi:hypothetical protein DEJ23_13960 [Curtobacterium sp. MCSS17_008]|nr:hypothetical protein DEJ23_13960 [Curtobacterium sp. MCSS17_008]
MTRYRRLALGIAAVMTVALLAGCSGQLPGVPGDSTSQDHGSEARVRHHGPTPTAMRHEDGVEVWDLTGPPTVEALGIDTDGRETLSNAVGAYSSTPERPVRMLLPGGRTVEMAAGEVIFEAADSREEVTDPDSGKVIIPQGRQFWLRVDGLTEEGVDAGVGAFRDALEQADLPTTKADELRERASTPAATADTPSTKRIGESVELPDVQGATASISSTFKPRPDVLVFQLQFHLNWDPVPIP